MENVLRYLHLVLLLAAFGILSLGVAVQAEDDQQEILVGRITHVEGELLRYIEDDKDWVLTVKDAPFGLEDALYSGEEAKAEFIMPNWTWVRVGENTQLQLIALSTDATSMDVASGLARVYNKSDDAVVKVTTPFGYVVAPGGTAFDLYVGDESLEVIAVQGRVDFVHQGTEVKYEVEEGSSSIIANAGEAGRGNGTVDSGWDDWNGKRDDIWMERLQRSESSAGFLPDPIRYESYALEENGRWERVYYEGEYRDMWRPTRVDPGWRPFTAGRWTVYYGDNCWIPDESFGYVTHHYGSWIYIESFRAWYWVPPAPRFVVDTPSVFIGFGWYPGRVGWIHSGPSIGWVPLAPNEDYYGYRPWGRRTVIVKHNTVINVTNVRYRFLDEAVIIDRDHFYRGSRYTPHVKRDIRRDVLINSYRPVTVINNTVINNFNSDKRRFAYNDEKVSRKPHVSVVNRINDNERSSRNFGRGSRERIHGDLARINTGSEPPSRSNIRAPMLATRLVDVDKTSQPLDRLSSEKKEIKPRDRERQVRAGDGERRRVHEQEQFDKTRDNAGQEEKRRLRSPRESRNEVSEQEGRQQDQVRRSDAGGGRQEPGIQQRQAEEGKGRERQQPPSPRMVKGKSQEELQQGRPQKESQVRQEPKPSRPPSEDGGLRQEREIQKRQEEEGKGRERQPPPSPKTVRGTQQEEPQQVLPPPPADDPRRLKSPRDRENREVEQSVPQQDQVRQQKENQVRQEQEVRRQQEEEGGRRQAREIQQRQAEEVKAKQEDERNTLRQDQVRQQKENQVRQEQEVRRQQEDGKRRQEQEAKRQRGEEVKARQAAEQRALQQDQARQQKENQVRQEQEVRRQQEQGKRQQEQEVQQRRQQEEGKRQQEQEVQQRRQQEQEVKRRQQEEGKRRQEQEAQQRQQQEQQQANQRRQEQEVQRRQQEAKQVQQRPEKQRQQPEPAPNPQGQQPQAAKNKSKKQLEEEERLLREQQSPKN